MKSAKHIISAVLALQLTHTAAYADITVKVNDRTIVMDSSPYISENNTLVPIRFIAEALGCDVSWDSEEKKAQISDNETNIVLFAESNTAYVNNEKKTLGTKVSVKNNRTYVPLRFVAENMGADVHWDEENQSAIIYKGDIKVDLAYDEDELYWLAKIIHAEARGEVYEGKVAVGNVVLNRVADDYFPDTIYSVIFDRKNGVQFSPVADGAINLEPSNESYYAADRALNGESYVGNSLYFCNPEKSTNTWIIKNRPFFTRIGTHNFYL